MKLFSRLFLAWTFFDLSNCFFFNIKNSISTTKLKRNCINSTDWSLPELYAPPSIIPLIPYELARSLMISKYANALSEDSDVNINQCEYFRQNLNENSKSYKFPKDRYGIIADKFLIGFFAFRKNNINHVNLESILPLSNDKNTGNITIIFDMLNLQYKTCIISTKTLHSYWKQILLFYKCYSL